MQEMIYAPTGEKHGLINSMGNNVVKKEIENCKDKEKFEKARKEDGRVVKAKYLNARGDGERCSKVYMRWPGDRIQFWHFIPGETYDVPMGLVNEVNATSLAQRSEVLDKDGMPTKRDGKSLHIHQFVAVGF
ncbi:MAG: hypothetical protein ACOYMC_12555 [Pirellulales bacterium]